MAIVAKIQAKMTKWAKMVKRAKIEVWMLGSAKNGQNSQFEAEITARIEVRKTKSDWKVKGVEFKA